MSRPATPVADPPQTLRAAIAESLRRKPIIAVVRTNDPAEAQRQALLFAESGLELIEITFTVPEAASLVRTLLRERGQVGPPFFGMGTVTTQERAAQALQAGTEFVVTPNTSAAVAAATRDAGLFLALGALTATEVVEAHRQGADIVKVFPLPPVGGPAYLRALRQPLGDIPMMASGGYGVEEIADYRAAGAEAFGIGPPLLGADDEATRRNVRRALELAGGAMNPAAATTR
jgi:2-dehydro-3-deoxyphosphogluconate aldolase / (4S)-4-hydroxy-2-oxoglutarate aldolase